MTNDYLTFKELTALEEVAGAGNKEAQEKLNSLARDEGYQDWVSLNESLIKESTPFWEDARKKMEDEKKRRESTPNFMYCMAYLERLAKSQNPLDRAIYESMPYRQIYQMAKALDKELMSASPASAAQAAEPHKPKKQNKAWSDRAWAWRQISAKVKNRVLRRPIDCIREIQSKPGHAYFKMSTKTMGRVMREGMAGEYDSP